MSGNKDSCMLMVADVLKGLGHSVPDEQELKRLISQAADRTKSANGLDPARYSLKLVPVEKEWMTAHLD